MAAIELTTEARNPVIDVNGTKVELDLALVTSEPDSPREVGLEAEIEEDEYERFVAHVQDTGPLSPMVTIDVREIGRELPGDQQRLPQ